MGKSQHLEESKRQRCKLSRKAHTSYQILSNAIASPDVAKFSFSKEDASHILQPYSDALIITMLVSEFNIHRTLVDDGSSVNVLYLRTFKEWRLTNDILPPYQRRIITNFVIVDLPSNYNATLGRPELKVTASIYHYAMKFSTLHGVGIVRRCQTMARSCNITFLGLGVNMLHEERRRPYMRSDQNELKEELVEELRRLDPRSD
ncbi:Uncharacterized protein Adt_31051 [Abeliophyllum distichum]|uniref:Uncharacterized protein n=1 Tax=Abeliophyllum distichum TaxID=126358 RepID=A0ABD1RD08_9LAMI